MVDAGIRSVYAHAVVSAAHVRDSRIEAAFAAVPRERFLGPPPWDMLDAFGATRSTSDPAQLYQDVLVRIDRTRGINNGEPQLWAFVFDRLDVRPSSRILHVGAGTGYYTAVLAELVGPAGSVTAMEIEVDLARRAADALEPWRQIEVRQGNAAALVDLPFDRIVFSCGITDLPPTWLERRLQGARIAAPFTGTRSNGVFMMLTHAGSGIGVSALCGVAIYPAAGFRDKFYERQLDGIMLADPQALWNVRSLRKIEDTLPAERIYGFAGYAMTGMPGS